MMKGTEILWFKQFTDGRGSLIPIEGNKDIPFDIRRIYYIFHVPGDIARGFHAHVDLQQILLCVSGSVKIKVKSLHGEEVFVLDNPSKGLLIGDMLWREMYDFSNDAVLLVLASKAYSDDDYIRNYDEFIHIAQEHAQKGGI